MVAMTPRKKAGVLEIWKISPERETEGRMV